MFSISHCTLRGGSVRTTQCIAVFFFLVLAIRGRLLLLWHIISAGAFHSMSGFFKQNSAYSARRRIWLSLRCAESIHEHASCSCLFWHSRSQYTMTAVSHTDLVSPHAIYMELWLHRRQLCTPPSFAALPHPLVSFSICPYRLRLRQPSAAAGFPARFPLAGRLTCGEFSLSSSNPGLVVKMNVPCGKGKQINTPTSPLHLAGRLKNFVRLLSGLCL